MGLKGERVLRRVLRRGSKKGLSRRRVEGRNTPFRRVRPRSRAPYNSAIFLCVMACATFSQDEGILLQKYLSIEMGGVSR